MEQTQHLVDQNFPLFKRSRKPSINPSPPTSNKPNSNPITAQNNVVTHKTLSNPENTTAVDIITTSLVYIPFYLHYILKQ